MFFSVFSNFFFNLNRFESKAFGAFNFNVLIFFIRFKLDLFESVTIGSGWSFQFNILEFSITIILIEEDILISLIRFFILDFFKSWLDGLDFNVFS